MPSGVFRDSPADKWLQAAGLAVVLGEWGPDCVFLEYLLPAMLGWVMPWGNCSSWEGNCGFVGGAGGYTSLGQWLDFSLVCFLEVVGATAPVVAFIVFLRLFFSP